MTLARQKGMPTLRVAYFYAGPDRKCTVGRSLWKLCKASGHGLAIEELDILVGGKSHDLRAKDIQEGYITDAEGGVCDLAMFSPPCGSLSRANFANALSQPIQSLLNHRCFRHDIFPYTTITSSDDAILQINY